ncbi:MAG: putative ABC transporter permease subunit [Candidatus Goldiibacteriota bacterium]
MKDFFLVFGLYRRQILNRIKNMKKEQIMKLVLMLALAALFLPFVFGLFYWIFRHFYSVAIAGPLLVRNLLYTFYLTFSVLMVLSAVVSAIPVMYLSRDMDFLFSAPVKVETVFSVRYLKVITDACWMIFIMSVPIFAAYSVVLKLSPAEFVLIVAAHIPFFIVSASIGILLTLVLVRFFPAENIRNTAIAVFGIFIVAFVVYFRMLQPEKLTGAGVEQIMDFIKNLKGTENMFMPHTHFIKLVSKATAEGIYGSLPVLGLHFVFAALVLAGVVFAAKYLYFEGYGKKGGRKKEGALSAKYSFAPKKLFFSGLSKDFKYLIRDTSQWIQVVFLMGIIIIYLFNMYKLPADVFNLRNLIYFLNIGFIGFVLAAVGARFVLPVISVEGRGFWIYKTAPVAIEKYVMDKFLIYGIPVMIIGQIVAWVSILILKSGGFINYVTVFSAFMTTLVISGAGAGLGAFFADFNIKNPEDLITGFAGLTYMFITMLYVGLILVLEAGPVRAYYMSGLTKGNEFIFRDHIWNFAAIAVLGAALTAMLLASGISRLKKMEI